MDVTLNIVYKCACFIVTCGHILAMTIRQEERLSLENCTYTPAEPNLPCLQYRTDFYEYCREEWFRARFPALYEVDGSKTADWPGDIQDLDARPEVVKWRPPTDGSIESLRGFFVKLSGISMESFGRNICVIVDLHSMSESDRKAVMNSTFVVDVAAPGDFIVEVDPLPPPSPVHKHEHQQVTKPSIPLEYHPKFVKQDLAARPLNVTHVNVTLTLEPEPEGVSAVYVMVTNYTMQHPRVVEQLSQTLPYPQKFYILDGFEEGNYTLELWPTDEYSSDPSRCICYTGTPEQRSCVVCEELWTTVHIRGLDKNSGYVSDGRAPSTTVIVGAVTGSVLSLAVLIATAFVLIRRHVLPRDLIDKFIRRRKSIPVDGFPKLNIFFVFAADNPAHTAAVKAFMKLVESFDGFEILDFEDTSPSSVGSNDSLSSGGFRSGIAMEHADVIVVVRSAWATELLAEMRTKTVYASDAPSDEDCRFISGMHQIKHNPSLSSKIVSVSFEYSTEAISPMETFNGTLNVSIGEISSGEYYIPGDLQKFISHLYSRSEYSCPAYTQSFDQERQQLLQAISSCSSYQCKNRNWLAKKMFLLKAYWSSDDSGIVTHRRKTKFRRSVRSRSAETASSARCPSTCHVSRTDVGKCSLIQSKRPRTLSCDLSFIPPESERDDQSVRYSLLESKFAVINERYQYILNNKLMSEDDCLTIDGKSV